MKIYCGTRSYALGCCGITELYDFISDENLYSETASSAVKSRGNVQALIASTADQEDVVVELKKLKFKAVRSFVNPGSGNKVTVWFRKPGGK